MGDAGSSDRSEWTQVNGSHTSDEAYANEGMQFLNWDRHEIEAWEEKECLAQIDAKSKQKLIVQMSFLCFVARCSATLSVKATDRMYG